MCKRYSSCLVVLLLGVGIGFAQTGSQTLQEQFETVKQMNYLNQVGIYFINPTTKATPKDYNLIINQGEKKKLTLLLKNESDRDLNFRVKFADQATSNAGTRGCLAQYDKGFSDFVTVPRKGDILVPAKSQTEKNIELVFPVGVEGIQKGCIAYGVTEDAKKNAKPVISIITRRVMFLDALVGGTGEIDYRIAMGNIDKNINDQGELEIRMDAQNVGNVDSTISIVGNISNILGFEKPIAIEEKIIKGEKGTLMVNIGKLPFYKGMFTIKLNIKDKPDFGFDGSKFEIDPKIIAGGEKNIHMLYFVAHWRMLITLLLLISIFYGVLRKSKVAKKAGRQKPI